MDFLKLASGYKDEALAILKELLAFKSVLDEFNPNSDAPFGLENKKALEYILNVGEKLGFSVKNVDNYAGHIDYGQGELLGILAHLDVVPVNASEWDSDPFIMRIEDGKLYARGSEDDKGPLVASLFAMKLLKDNGIKLNKKVRLIMGCDEESGSRCLEYYFKKEEMPALGFSPDAEFPVIYGEKAMASYDLFIKRSEDEVITSFKAGTRYNIVPSKATMKLNIDLKKEFLDYLKLNKYEGMIEGDEYIAYGIASHAMVPQNGLNAIFILMDFLKKHTKSKIADYFDKYLTFDSFGEKFAFAYDDLDMGKLTQNVAVLNLEGNMFKIGINYRIPVDNYTAKLEEAFSKSFREGDYFNLLSSSTRHYVAKDSTLVKALMKSYQEITNDYETKPFTIGGGTYAKFIDNCVAFGPQMPNKPDVCHIANEYIEIDDFIKSIAIYAKAIYELGK